MRLDDGTNTVVARKQSSAIHADNQTNHLELVCNGTTITGRVNGVQVVSVQDSKYLSGLVWLTAGLFNEFLPATSDARFDNLVIQPGGSASTSAPAQPESRLGSGAVARTDGRLPYQFERN